MTGTLYINGKDAYSTWGVYPEKGALAALMTPAPVKNYITNTTPYSHGEVVADSPNALPKVDKRSVQIPLVLAASTQEQFQTRYASFVQELQGGKLDIKTKYQPGVVYHCFYTSCAQFAQYNGTLAKFALKMNEPNPTDRTEHSNDND